MHNIHLINSLVTVPSFINYKLTEENYSLPGYNFANHVIEADIYILYFHQLLGYSSVKTTMIYNYVADKGINLSQFPSDIFNLKAEIKK
jgi:hypothetical protein